QRRPKRKESASRRRDSMSDQRQNNQLRLAFSEENRSEAPKSASRGSESLTAKRRTESPAIEEQLMAGFEASEVQQGKSGYRRHDGRGVVRTLAGALASHPGTTAQRDLQAAAGEAGRDSETGRRDASAGHPDG